MHFQQKVHAGRKIYPLKTRGSERDEEPEKERFVFMVEERAKGSWRRSRMGARGVERSGSFTLDARSSTPHLSETIPVAISCFRSSNSPARSSTQLPASSFAVPLALLPWLWHPAGASCHRPKTHERLTRARLALERPANALVSSVPSLQGLCIECALLRACVQ